LIISVDAVAMSLRTVAVLLIPRLFFYITDDVMRCVFYCCWLRLTVHFWPMPLTSVGVINAPKSCRVTPVRYLRRLKSNERVEYKLLSVADKSLTTTQPSYLCNLSL